MVELKVGKAPVTEWITGWCVGLWILGVPPLLDFFFIIILNLVWLSHLSSSTFTSISRKAIKGWSRRLNTWYWTLWGPKLNESNVFTVLVLTVWLTSFRKPERCGPPDKQRDCDGWIWAFCCCVTPQVNFSSLHSGSLTNFALPACTTCTLADAPSNSYAFSVCHGDQTGRLIK